MDLGLGGKAALVTAASKGIGRAIATELAREGARVVISSRDEGALARTAAEIREETGSTVEEPEMATLPSTSCAKVLPATAVLSTAAPTMAAPRRLLVRMGLWVPPAGLGAGLPRRGYLRRHCLART